MISLREEEEEDESTINFFKLKFISKSESHRTAKTNDQYFNMYALFSFSSSSHCGKCIDTLNLILGTSSSRKERQYERGREREKGNFHCH